MDIAIIHAHEPPPSCESLLIACDLLEAPLIHEEGPSRLGRLVGAGGDHSRHSLERRDSDIALAAAELGQGVALASLFLAETAIAAGALEQPFAATIESGRSWYAISIERQLGDENVQDAWHWLGRMAENEKLVREVKADDARRSQPVAPKPAEE